MKDVYAALSGPELPVRLASAPRAPSVLWVRGAVPESTRVVALVGARAATFRALETARGMAAELAEAGVLVISGGAVGVDSAAHQGALDSGRPTVAVLAGGLDRPYPPQNQPLFDRIVARGGALLSMHPPGTPPMPRTFVDRNAVIAALSDAVVLFEAGFRSGSLHTARAAHRFGRAVMAAPGGPACDRMLAEGAIMAESAADVLAALEGRPRFLTARLPAGGSREALALASLDREAPLTGSAVAKRSGLPLREATRALVGLELDGLALLLPGQVYLRSPVAERLLTGTHIER